MEKKTARPPEALDRQVILAACQCVTSNQLAALELLQSTTSTNDELLSRPADKAHARAILAEEQSAGKGRWGKSWHSPAGRNIYLSLGWRFDEPGLDLSRLQLAVAIAASRALHRAGLDGQRIKRPNDLMLGDRKLGGCLVETRGRAGEPLLAVVGVGVNVYMQGDDGVENIDQAWTDVGTHLPDISRNTLAACLLDSLLEALPAFQESGFETFRADWKRLSG